MVWIRVRFGSSLYQPPCLVADLVSAPGRGVGLGGRWRALVELNAVLPCRHMCMCSGCARMLRHQTNRCPICRTTVEGLLEIKVERRAT